MATSPELTNIQLIAEAHLRRSQLQQVGRPSSWPIADRFGMPTAVFWWDDDTPLFEVPLYRGNSPAGYVIASGTRALPPILEASPNGLPPSSRMAAAVTSHLVQTGRFPVSIHWQYWSPLEIVAEVVLHDESVTYVRFPDMSEVTTNSRLAINRVTDEYWRSTDVERLWKQLVLSGSPKPQRSIGIILNDREPVYYNQNFFEQTVSDEKNLTSAKCISGCSPVAFAMWASSWKKVDKGGSKSKIWPNSSCWKTSWPSDMDPDPNKCTVVNRTIWKIHDVFATTCQGATKIENSSGPAGKYFLDAWGLKWSFAFKRPVSFAYCSDIIKRKHPFVFSAMGEWGRYFEGTDSSLFRDNTVGKAAHSVLCWGFQAGGMATGSSLLIGLGWGKEWESRWIEFSAFSQTGASYVTSFG